jgi:threonine aldolase
MADAKVGDDVFGDDPTVIELEERAAELTGKQAGLFVSSGTMGNLVSLMAQVPRGGEIVAGEGAHTFAHEAANYAVVVGAGIKLLPGTTRARWSSTRYVALSGTPWTRTTRSPRW